MKSQKEETSEKNVRIVFGLEAQGHIPTIENMIEKFGHFPTDQWLWERIAKEIGWSTFATVAYYAQYLKEKSFSKRETPEKPDFEAMAEDYVRQPHYDDNGHKGSYKAGMERIWRDYVVASKEVEGWIDVKERMPEPNVLVLVNLKYGAGKQEIKFSYTTTRFPDCFDHLLNNLITHWRPLPEPPTKK